MTREELIEEVTWLLDSGENPERVADRLGLRRASIERSLIRAGQLDLATRMRVPTGTRPRTTRVCADCPATLTKHGAQRCRSCANRELAHRRWSVAS